MGNLLQSVFTSSEMFNKNLSTDIFVLKAFIKVLQACALYGINDTKFDSLEEKINTMINLSEEEIINIGKINRKNIEDNYSEEVHYQQLLQVYNEVSKATMRE